MKAICEDPFSLLVEPGNLEGLPAVDIPLEDPMYPLLQLLEGSIKLRQINRALFLFGLHPYSEVEVQQAQPMQLPEGQRVAYQHPAELL